MSDTRKITAGLYTVTGTFADDGLPLRVDRVDWRPYLPENFITTRPYWAVTNAMGREFSQHPTKREAVAAAVALSCRQH